MSVVRVVIRNRNEVLPYRGGPDETDSGLWTTVSVANPTFDVTPSGAVDTVVTERGTLDAGDIEAIAAEHRQLRGWQAVGHRGTAKEYTPCPRTLSGRAAPVHT